MNKKNKLLIRGCLVFLILVQFPLLMKAQVEEMTLTPNFDECAPPHIKIFKDEDRLNAEWKIVIGRRIEYQANPYRPNSWNWNWEIGDNLPAGGGFTRYWNFVAVPPPDLKRKGKAQIPLNAVTSSNTMPVDNTSFGEAHGVVNVTANGNTNYINSGLNKAQIFFEKDGSYLNDTAYPSGVPNWFYYWSQLVGDRLDLPFNINIWNDDDAVDEYEGHDINVVLRYENTGSFAMTTLDGFDLYGQTLGRVDATKVFTTIYNANAGEQQLVLTAWQPTILIGPQSSRLCGYSYEYFDGAGPTPYTVQLAAPLGTGRTGIECFLENLEHELEHLRIWNENWPNGYIKSEDPDFDFYSNSWEIAHAGDGFLPNVSQLYQGGYPSDLNGVSVGTLYEESRCRTHQENFPNSNSLNNNDWSFDKLKTNDNNIYQGKQW